MRLGLNFDLQDVNVHGVAHVGSWVCFIMKN